MTKLLNLDEIAPATKEVLLGGVKHKVNPLSFGAFVAMQKLMQKKNATMQEQLDTYIQVVLSVVPTITREKLESMTFEQIIALVNFVSEDAEAENQDGAESQSEGKE